MTGTVGALLAAGLLVLVTVDLTHRAAPASAPPERPPRTELSEPALSNCCSAADPVESIPPRPKPSLALLAAGEVPTELQALDRDLTIPLTAAQIAYLRTALATAVPADVPSPSYMIRRYPRLQVVAHGPNGDLILTLNNLERLGDPRNPTDGWSMPPGLWEEVASWLPPETSLPGELAYLLRAEQLIEPHPSGLITYGPERAALVARILQTGTPTDESAGEVQFTHTYVVEGKEYRVEVWFDGFAYAGHHYHLKEAAVMTGATLHAN